MNDRKQTTEPYVSDICFDAERIGAAAVYCSDGRYGDQMDEFLHHGLGLPRYDRVAIPGGAACLASHIIAAREAGAVEKQLRFLIDTHALQRLVLIAHQDCGFYKRLRLRVPLEEQQRTDLRAAAARIREFGQGVQVEDLFRAQGGTDGAVRAGGAGVKCAKEAKNLPSDGYVVAK